MKVLIKGFTVIELMIILVIVGIVAAIAIPVFTGDRGNNKVTFTRTAMIESVCIDGYKWVVVPRQEPVQVMGNDGTPVICGGNWQ